MPERKEMLAQGTVEANAVTRRDAFDRSDCGNGPDDEGNWPCEPKVLFGAALAECQTCGRVAAWGDSGGMSA